MIHQEKYLLVLTPSKNLISVTTTIIIPLLEKIIIQELYLYLTLAENNVIVRALQSIVRDVNAQLFKKVDVIIFPPKSVKKKNGTLG